MFVVTLSDRNNPRAVLAWLDGSNSGFSTDPSRAQLFEDLDKACEAQRELCERFPKQLIFVRSAAIDSLFPL